MSGIQGQQATGLTDLPSSYEHGLINRFDQRFKLAKELQAHYKVLVNDLGGIEHLSYQKQAIAEHAVFINMLIKKWQREYVEQKNMPDMGKLTQAINSLLGLLKTLGLDRQAQDVSLTGYLEK